MYDTEGRLLDRLETGVQKVSEYNIDFVNMLQRADGLVLWLNLSKTFQEDEDGTVHQRVEGTKCFVVQEKAIAQIAIDGSAEYVDVQDGKVLKLDGTKPEHIAADYFGYMMDGYEITVTDAKTDELLYRGKLKTDFVEDYNGELYAINIGQREKPLTERRDEESWIRYSSIGVKKRYFKMLLPVDGTAKQTSWVVGQEGGNMIEVKHIWFSYEQWGEFVLKDISFSVEKGEIVGVLGANGVGKTTLLKVLAGLLPPRPREKEPERGVWLNGKPIRECNAEIAFISEAGTYLKDLTPREYGAFLADFYPSFDMAYYEKLLHFFGLEEKPIKKMSKGQKAKAEVAAGMAKKTHILIMDEPFIGKDMFTRQDFMQALAGSLTGEETIFITTHEIDEIENFIDRALILKNGEIAADVRMDALRQENKSLQSLMKEVTGYKEGNLEELLS